MGGKPVGLVRTALGSRPVTALTSPRTIDDFLEQIHPMITVKLVRARVVRIIGETDVATTVVLRPNGAWQGFTTGQHIEFGVEVDGKRRVRVFTISSSEANRDGTISVSVKAHPDGYVSQFLRNDLTVGTIVHLSQARGEFVLPSSVPEHVALVSGGSGITPVMSMIRTLRDRGHRGRITFLHYAKSRDDEMFTEQLDELAGGPDSLEVIRVYTRDRDDIGSQPPGTEPLVGRFSIDHLKQLGVDPTSVPTWVCGPAGLIASVSQTYADLGAEDMLHSEYFKVPTVDLEAADATGSLTFETSGMSVENAGTTILEQAEGAGLEPEYGCRMGVCNGCAIKKLSGAVRHIISGEVAANTDETINVCVQIPVGDVSVAL